MGGVLRGLEHPKVFKGLGERLWEGEIAGRGLPIVSPSLLGSMGGRRGRHKESGASCGSRAPIAG